MNNVYAPIIFLFSSFAFSNTYAWTMYWNESKAIPEAQSINADITCIPNTVIVGDTVLLAGKFFIVKSIPQVASACTDQIFPIQATLEANSKANDLEKRLPNITVPDGYKRNYRGETPSLRNGPLMFAIDPKLDAAISLFVSPRPPQLLPSSNPSTQDLDKLAKIALAAINNYYENPVVSEPIKIKINGVDVWRNIVSGIPRNSKSKIPVTFMQTHYSGDTDFVFLKQWTSEANFSKYQAEFEATASSIQNLNSSSVISNSR